MDLFLSSNCIIQSLQFDYFIGLWQLLLSPHPQLSAFIITVLWVIPLLLPLPGIFAAKPYTHAWANFILMFYVLHAVTLIVLNDGERTLAAIELIIVSICFVNNILFARLRAKELGIKLKRLSQVEREERTRYHD
ncbi:membrane protein [Photobacterium iliopiscarium]|nr:membrane protein [Photobacterium iliopiscarium]